MTDDRRVAAAKFGEAIGQEASGDEPGIIELRAEPTDEPIDVGQSLGARLERAEQIGFEDVEVLALVVST